jgi:DNA-binding transcriptional MocR family regulator
VEVSPNVDTAPLKQKAVAAGSGFQPGNLFSSSGGLHNYMRLSFAHYAAEDIVEGIARLRPIFDGPPQS